MLITYFFISFVDAICHNSLSRCLFAARNCSIFRSFYLFSEEKKQNIGVKHFVTDKADIVDALEFLLLNVGFKIYKLKTLVKNKCAQSLRKQRHGI